MMKMKKISFLMVICVALGLSSAVNAQKIALKSGSVAPEPFQIRWNTRDMMVVNKEADYPTKKSKNTICRPAKATSEARL
jgi:hypothetical protein